MTMPISVFSSFISSRILAMTGRAEMAMAVPRNRGNNRLFGARSLEIEPLRKKPGHRKSGGKGQDHAAETGEDRHPTMLEKQGKPQFEASHEKQQDHRQGKDGIKGEGDVGVGGKGEQGSCSSRARSPRAPSGPGSHR